MRGLGKIATYPYELLIQNILLCIKDPGTPCRTLKDSGNTVKKKMTAGTLEERSDKSLTLMTFNIQHSTNGPMDQRTNGPMDQWTNGLMDQWTNGPMYQWTNGPMDQWSHGPIVQCS